MLNSRVHAAEAKGESTAVAVVAPIAPQDVPLAEAVQHPDLARTCDLVRFRTRETRQRRLLDDVPWETRTSFGDPQIRPLFEPARHLRLAGIFQDQLRKRLQQAVHSTA